MLSCVRKRLWSSDHHGPDDRQQSAGGVAGHGVLGRCPAGMAPLQDYEVSISLLRLLLLRLLLLRLLLLFIHVIYSHRIILRPTQSYHGRCPDFHRLHAADATRTTLLHDRNCLLRPISTCARVQLVKPPCRPGARLRLSQRLRDLIFPWQSATPSRLNVP